MSSPQIIRTVEELEALDPMTLVQPNPSGDCHHEVIRAESLLYIVSRWGWEYRLPAAVVATADQVREARKALEEAAKPTRPDSHEMQGILGSDWLDGESPADLIRKHREGRA